MSFVDFMNYIMYTPFNRFSMIQSAPLTVVFYRTANGAVPVREWLRAAADCGKREVPCEAEGSHGFCFA